MVDAVGTILNKDPLVMASADLRNNVLELVIDTNRERITVRVRGKKLADLIRFAMLAQDKA